MRLVIQKGLVFCTLMLAACPAVAKDLADEVANVCTQQGAVPTNLTSAETPAYCKCEAAIWARRGTETQMRYAMTFMTNDKSYMNGEVYNYDDALEFIVSHDGEVKAACLPY